MAPYCTSAPSCLRRRPAGISSEDFVELHWQTVDALTALHRARLLPLSVATAFTTWRIWDATVDRRSLQKCPADDPSVYGMMTRGYRDFETLDRHLKLHELSSLGDDRPSWLTYASVYRCHYETLMEARW